MKTVYTVAFCEEGLQSDGFYEVESMKEFMRYLKWYAKNGNKVTICINECEIEKPCDICSAGSVKECVNLVIKK